MLLRKLRSPFCFLSRCVARPQAVSPPLLLQDSLLHTPTPRFNSNRTCVVRCDRNVYERLYPVVLVQPDGSTLYIKYNEPRRILMMPVNIASLSEEERRARQKKREVRKTTTEMEVDYKDDFRADTYSHLWKKK